MQLDSATQSSAALSPMEIDAIGEVLNISMGSAATAVSTMLDTMVNITTPKVSVERLGMLEYSSMQPALAVKITYTEGIDGTNVMVFRQRDMQLILNQLMGIDDPPSDDFEFDDLSMSAACEVMNQMMGASATALSDFLGRTVNISTPVAKILSPDYTFTDAVGLPEDVDIVSVEFNLDIQNLMNTEFVSAMPCALARSIIGGFMGDAMEEPAPAPAPEAAPAPTPAPAVEPAPAPAAPVQQPAPMAAAPAAQMPQQQMPMQQPQMQQMPQMQQQMPQMPMTDPAMMQQMAPGYPPYYPGYPPYQPYAQGGYPPYYPPYPPYPPQQPAAEKEKEQRPPIKVQNVQYPEFGRTGAVSGDPVLGGNAELLMNVPLDVTIEIGQAKRKIKDIMDFAQGTVIELEKQAGAPVDIVVNGQLIAHGDVVVIDDNFGVRITEILGTKELLNSLGKELK